MSNSSFLAVTPSDSVALSAPTRRFYVGVSGNVSALAVGDTSPIVFTGLPVGWTNFPVPISQIFNTSTTASAIVAYYGPAAFG